MAHRGQVGIVAREIANENIVVGEFRGGLVEN